MFANTICRYGGPAIVLSKEISVSVYLLFFKIFTFGSERACDIFTRLPLPCISLFPIPVLLSNIAFLLNYFALYVKRCHFNCFTCALMIFTVYLEAYQVYEVAVNAARAHLFSFSRTQNSFAIFRQVSRKKFFEQIIFRFKFD